MPWRRRSCSAGGRTAASARRRSLERKSRLLGPLAASRPVAGPGPGGRPGRPHRVGQGPPGRPGRLRSGRPEPPAALYPRRCPAGAVAGLYARYEDEKVRRGLSTSTICWLAAPTPSRPTPPSPPPSAGAGATSSSTSSRTSTRCSTACCWPGWAPRPTSASSATRNQAVYGWNGADPDLLAQVAAALAVRPRSCAWTTTTAARPRSWPRPRRCSAAAGAHLRSAGEDGPPTRSCAPSLRDRRGPRHRRRAPRAPTRAGGGLDGRADPHQRPAASRSNEALDRSGDSLLGAGPAGPAGTVRSPGAILDDSARTP